MDEFGALYKVSDTTSLALTTVNAVPFQAVYPLSVICYCMGCISALDFLMAYKTAEKRHVCWWLAERS